MSTFLCLGDRVFLFTIRASGLRLFHWVEAAVSGGVVECTHAGILVAGVMLVSSDVLGAAVINRLHVIIDIVLADVLHYQGRT